MQSYRTVSISELTPGCVLLVPVFDQKLRKLLHSGIKIDDRLITRLRERGINEFHVDSSVKKLVAKIHKPVSTDSQETQKVQRCSLCRAVIDIRPPMAALMVTVWRCNQCGSIYFGSNEQEADLRGLTRADRCDTIDAAAKGRAAPSILPEHVQRLTKSLSPEESEWEDRRRHKRYPISIPVVALPLSLDFRVDGDALPMTTRNLSLGGVALLHTRFLDAAYLAIDFAAAGEEKLQVVLKVLRCRPLGLAYEIGGEFISRVA
jgi:hypothetical protein